MLMEVNIKFKTYLKSLILSYVKFENLKTFISDHTGYLINV